jgi:uncharacterized protein (TIGR02145 family)/uncharacterized repeat protein (TIGR02543 family)
MGKSIFNVVGIAVAAVVLFIGCDEAPVDSGHILTTAVNPPGSGTVKRIPDNKSYPEGQDVVVTAVAEKGYEFVEWDGSLQSTKNVVTITMTDRDETLLAVFRKDTTTPQNAYKITFNANGGSVTQEADTTGADGTLASLPTPTRSGYTFKGWFTAATGGDSVTASRVYSANATIYAGWEAVSAPAAYTVTFNAGGGTVSPASVTTGADGKLASLPTPARSGYAFKGWFTAATDGDSVTVNMVYGANAIVYARWEAVSGGGETSYTITFNYNYSGSTNTTATTGADGKLASLPAPTRSGYAFKGWFTAATGGDSVTINNVYSANDTVYAGWGETAPTPPSPPPVVTTFTDSRDGKTYKKVAVGTQTWMAENLNYDTTGVCYANSADSCAKYGMLYNWDAATTSCPDEWRLPSDAEWAALVGGVSAAGTKLKSSMYWDSYSGVSAGTDDFGFSALPGGYGYGGNFDNAGYRGIWWSATEYDAGYAWYRGVSYDSEQVYRYGVVKSYQFSVRCVQD